VNAHRRNERVARPTNREKALRRLQPLVGEWILEARWPGRESRGRAAVLPAIHSDLRQRREHDHRTLEIAEDGIN